MREARRIQKRRRFSENPSDRQNTAGDDAIHAARKYHSPDHAPLARTQTERALSIGLRHSLETFLRGTHDGRQIHDD